MEKIFGWFVCQVVRWLELGLTLLHWQVLWIYKCNKNLLPRLLKSKILGEEILMSVGERNKEPLDYLNKVQTGRFCLNGLPALLLVEVENKQNNKNVHHQSQVENHVQDLRSLKDHATNNHVLMRLTSTLVKKSTLLF